MNNLAKDDLTSLVSISLNKKSLFYFRLRADTLNEMFFYAN